MPVIVAMMKDDACGRVADSRGARMRQQVDMSPVVDDDAAARAAMPRAHFSSGGSRHKLTSKSRHFR